MNISVTGTVRQVAFKQDNEGAVVGAVVKVESDVFGIIDLTITNPALAGEFVEGQPTAEVLDPAGGFDPEGKPNMKLVFSGKHVKTGQPFSAQFSI